MVTLLSRTIEEVQKFKYLDFVINNKGKYKEHIRKLSKKGRSGKENLGIKGENMQRNNFKRKWSLFRYLVQSHGIWSKHLIMGRNRGIEKDNARLCKVNFWIGVLYLMIHNYKRVGDGEIKSRRFKSEEIRKKD